MESERKGNIKGMFLKQIRWCPVSIGNVISVQLDTHISVMGSMIYFTRN